MRQRLSLTLELRVLPHWLASNPSWVLQSQHWDYGHTVTHWLSLLFLLLNCMCWASELVPSCLGNKEFIYWAVSLILGYEGEKVENKMDKEGREICHPWIFYRVLSFKPWDCISYKDNLSQTTFYCLHYLFYQLLFFQYPVLILVLDNKSDLVLVYLQNNKLIPKLLIMRIRTVSCIWSKSVVSRAWADNFLKAVGNLRLIKAKNDNNSI